MFFKDFGYFRLKQILLLLFCVFVIMLPTFPFVAVLSLPGRLNVVPCVMSMNISAG